MSGKMLVTARMDQRLMMSQQLRQAITLLQYNTLDLKQLVQQFIEVNPLLEVEEVESEDPVEEGENHADMSDEEQEPSSYYSAELSRRNQFREDENTLENYSIPESLRVHLLDQTFLCGFTKSQQHIAEAIIDAIDDNGYLTMSLDDLHKAMIDFLPDNDINEIETILKTIQTFDPVGVGARDPRECLLIQLDACPDKGSTWKIAHTILYDYFDDLSTRNTKKMVKRLGLTQQEYVDAIELIRTLNPHPGSQFSARSDINIEPELYVKKIKNTWQVFLADSILTNTKINKEYQEIIKNNKRNKDYTSLKKELDEAKSFLSGLKRRNSTLFAVASYIVELQTDFLDQGQAFMKPLNIIDVSQALNFHESTVSRITNGKYIATPRGIFELKYFFPSHVNTKAGNACSAIAVKEFIKEAIQQETDDHVMSDGDIAEVLQGKGINIARRTVAKYREALKISPSYQRMRAQSCITKTEEEV